MKFLLLALFVAVATAAPTPDEDVGEPVELIVNGVPAGEALEIGEIVDISMKHHVDGELAATTNLLHPLTAVGIAEAAVAAALAAEETAVIPEAVVLPAPVAPEVVLPEPVVLPQPAAPEVVIPQPVVLPQPAAPQVVIPQPIVLPQPAAPQVVIPQPIVLPEPVAPQVLIPQPVVLPQPAAPEVVIPEAVVLPQPAAPEVVVPESVVFPNVQPEVIPTPVAQVPNGEIFNNGGVQVTVNGPEDAGVFATLQSWFNMVLNYINNGVQTTQQIV